VPGHEHYVLRTRETLERRAVEKIARNALDALALQLLLEALL
jgi:hypothetical protein